MHAKACKLLEVGALFLALALAGPVLAQAARPSAAPASEWRIGEPITTYWAGPPLTDAVATQMKEGGWNLAWCTESTLAVAQRHGLRAHLTDPLLKPSSLDSAKGRSDLDALIDRVKDNPALYSYQLKGELSVPALPAWARLARYIRERDPRHALQANLYPIYASNRQLGVEGDRVSAYQAYMQGFIQAIHPEILSYDHYNFLRDGDRDEYFLNLGLVRGAASAAGIPFMNIVQASSWKARFRVPRGNELRWLVYTSLAYGAQGISYFVYRPPMKNYVGGMANPDGTPTSLYPVASELNREFVAIASQLQGLASIGAFHAGMLPPGTLGLPDKVAVWPASPLKMAVFKSKRPASGLLFGYFGKTASTSVADASHVLVVNLDYKQARTIGLAARGSLSVFDAEARNWKQAGGDHVQLRLPAGGGRLLRVDP